MNSLQQSYHFGFDPATQELVLWKRGRQTEVCRIPLSNSFSLMETMAHVLAVQEAERMLSAQ